MAIDRYRVQVNGKTYDVTLDSKGGALTASIGGKTWEVDLRQYSDTSLVSLLLDNRSLELLVDRHGDTYTILRDTDQYRARVRPAWAGTSRRSEDAAEASELTIESPLVGMVIEVRATQGQQVQRGEVLMVIEAMKMQNELRAPRAGTVKALRVRAGQKVGAKQPLVVLA
jgi:biotin carboxyl carrier protein